MGGLDLECVITFEGKCPIDHCGEAIYFIKEQLEAKTTVHCRQCGNNVNAESILNSTSFVSRPNFSKFFKHPTNFRHKRLKNPCLTPTTVMLKV